MIRRRRAAQVLSLALFFLFLFRTQYPLGAWREVSNLYVEMSPFLALSTWLGAWRFTEWFVPAIVLVVLTLLLGRFFCGWVCPLGATLDLTDKLVAPKRRDESREPLRAKWFKYALLVTALVGAYFEANLAGWLDPLSLYTRTAATAFAPAIDLLARLVRDGLYPVRFLRPVSEGLFGFLSANVLSFAPQRFHGGAAIFLVFLAIVLAGGINRRFWCRFVCPLGAILAVVSRFSMFKKTVDEGKCTECLACKRSCRMGAITKDGKADWRGECIECFSCQAVCPQGAVLFRPVFRGADTEPVNLTRRGLMVSAAGGLVAAPLLRMGAEADSGSNLPAVRPPGTMREALFLQTCARCGECMRVCPTNCLQPAWFQTGVEGLWSPVVMSRFGYCEYTCNLCGQVCPTGALKLLDTETKQRLVMGTARIDHGRCIPWADGTDCAVCEEHCPVAEKAIRLHRTRTQTGAWVKTPSVLADLCVGCGACEKTCPVPGPAAIRVAGVPQYIRPAKPAGGSAEEIRSLFPEKMAGWKPGELLTYPGEKLFDFIDGAGDVYMEYGFVIAATREYVAGDSSVVVDVFRMKDGGAAYGIFTAERAPGTAERIGQGSSFGPEQGTFWQGACYVKVSGYGDRAAKELKRFGAAVAGRVRESGEVPAIMRALPANAVPGSERYVRGILALREYVDTKGQDIFGFKSGAEAAGYDAISGAKRTRALLLRFRSPRARADALAKLRDFLTKENMKPAAAPGFALAMGQGDSLFAAREEGKNDLRVLPAVAPGDLTAFSEIR